VNTIGRSPAGKVDYARHKAEAAAWVEERRAERGAVSG
jgi:hypothetical protein